MGSPVMTKSSFWEKRMWLFSESEQQERTLLNRKLPGVTAGPLEVRFSHTEFLN